LHQPFGQCLTLDELHHERRSTVGLLEAVERSDIGVVERCQELRLALEAGQVIGIVRNGIREDLEGDLALQPGVPRTVDLL